MWWTKQQLGTLDDALRAARSGRPETLLIVGDAGQGKSTLLRELIDRADGFAVHFIQGAYTERDRPYGALAQVLGGRTVEAGNPFQAAQLLRQAVDLGGVQATAIVVDDAQWADAESVETLGWLAGRASGDRLLLAVASSPLPAADRARRQLQDLPSIRIVGLSGLDQQQSAELARSVDPGVSDALAVRLHEHTGGNPLYLRSVLAEHTAAELEGRETLPAPAGLAAALTERARGLSHDAGAFLASLAILGDEWTPVPAAAELGAVAEPATAAQQLADAGLVVLRGTPAGTEARIPHAILRAAVEEALPAAERQRLHERAAALVTDTGRSLTHRMLATARYDDALAAELDAFAWTLHVQRRYREAGRFLRRAGRLSSGARARERRWLDALFEATLARDVDAVEDELSAVAWATDRVRAQLVQGFVLVVRKRWLEAADILNAVDGTQLEAAEDYVRYRVLTLQGWCRLVTGSPDPEVLPALEEARALAPADPGFTGYLTFAYAMARRAPADADPTVAADDRQRLYAAAWRGAAAALTGDADGAVRDLDAFTARIDSGAIDMGDGVFHALLGLALWLRGDWRRCSIALDVAQGARFGGTHPMVQAVLPLQALVAGDTQRAVELMAASRDSLRAAPWPQARAAATVVDTFVLALAGDAERQRGYRSGVFRDFGGTDLPGTVPSLWLLHAGVAASWAGDATAVERLARRLRDAPQGWAAAGATWLGGLAASARGDRRAAAEALELALTRWPAALRLHRWLLVSQLAMLTDDADAAALREEAATVLRGVGGSALLPDEDDPLALLSDREKDVVSLMAEGLSYAQIAKELYLSRSTVAFHLSNAYAKTGTGSRHELVQLLRRTAGQA